MNKLPTHFKNLLLPLSSSSSLLPAASQIYILQSKRTSEKSVFVLADFPYPLKNIKREELDGQKRNNKEGLESTDKVGGVKRLEERPILKEEEKRESIEGKNGSIIERRPKRGENEKDGTKFGGEEGGGRELGMMGGGMLEQVQPGKILNIQELEHFLTRTIKDFMVRYKMLKGYKVKYAIGVDLYGKEIEERAMKEALVKFYFLSFVYSYSSNLVF